jgi:hypothetical protein
MKNLFFLRSTTGNHSWEYYDSKTEALIFGDVEGYRYFVQCLENAKSSEKGIHFDEINVSSNSMRVLVAPVCKVGDSAARLRIIERPTYQHQAANMELVICGNVAGYDYLINLINQSMASGDADLDEHTHLDDSNDHCLLPRSVSLNIRHPLLKWAKENGHWTERIQQRQRDFLPEDIEYLFKEPEMYQEPSLEFIEQYLQIK